jgi:microcystin-dependent protein
VAETTTVNFNWTMPDPGGSANTWGATLNAATQAIDAQVFANQQAATAGQAPVGSVTMFASATPPAGWLICDGSSLATTGTYAALFAIIGYAFGGSGANFNLPNLQGVFPLGAGPSNALGSAAGAYNYTIALANLPSHAHPITDVAHNHAASQPAHVHPDPGHTHGASQDAHQHGGVQQTGVGNYYTFTGNPWFGPGVTDVQQPAVHISAAAAGLGAAQPAITVNASGTGLSTTQSVGGGAAMSIVPKYVALNYIIRYA